MIRTAERERANALSIVGDAMARPLAEALEGELAGADLSSVYALSSAGALLSEAVRAKLGDAAGATAEIEASPNVRTQLYGYALIAQAS